jgi:hypothetical protein
VSVLLILPGKYISSVVLLAHTYFVRVDKQCTDLYPSNVLDLLDDITFDFKILNA